MLSFMVFYAFSLLFFFLPFWRVGRFNSLERRVQRCSGMSCFSPQLYMRIRIEHG